MGLTLENIVEKSEAADEPNSLKENDPKPGPLAVMPVMTEEAVAVPTDPPKTMAAIRDFVVTFIIFLQKIKFSLLLLTPIIER
jgi:hypothetical protein